MIELLTVIAIIAILAALVFPVFNRVRENVRQNTCMDNLRSIDESLKLYHEDNAKYPAALFGFAQFVGSGGNKEFCSSGQALPMDQVSYRPLMEDKKASQKYMKDKGVFVCPDSPHNNPADITSTVYFPIIPEVPGRDQQAVFYSPTIRHAAGEDRFTCGGADAPANTPAVFYQYDSYDTAPRVDKDGRQVMGSDGQPITELHYSPDWTGLVDDPNDPPNQMKFPTPPEDTTVATWCSYHAPSAGQAIVLFLNGHAKTVPVGQLVQKGPLGFRF